jgi:hypothetical protein
MASFLRSGKRFLDQFSPINWVYLTLPNLKKFQWHSDSRESWNATNGLGYGRQISTGFGYRVYTSHLCLQKHHKIQRSQGKWENCFEKLDPKVSQGETVIFLAFLCYAKLF